MSLKKLIFATLFLFALQQSYGQRNYDGYNFLGIQGGITFFDIITDDLVTQQKEGFTAGFTTRGAFRNDFDLIYGLNFQSASVGVEGRGLLGNTENIGYTIQGVQLNFLGSYYLVFFRNGNDFSMFLEITFFDF